MKHRMADVFKKNIGTDCAAFYPRSSHNASRVVSRYKHMVRAWSYGCSSMKIIKVKNFKNKSVQSKHLEFLVANGAEFNSVVIFLDGRFKDYSAKAIQSLMWNSVEAGESHFMYRDIQRTGNCLQIRFVRNLPILF